jgi:hypothetical protein
MTEWEQTVLAAAQALRAADAKYDAIAEPLDGLFRTAAQTMRVVQLGTATQVEYEAADAAYRAASKQAGTAHEEWKRARDLLVVAALEEKNT